MPKIWTETIESHHRAVRDAALDAVDTLIAAHGLRSVSMSQVAEAAGVGRATLYKYFPDIESLLGAWHERAIETHLAEVATVRERRGDAADRLRAALETYAFILFETRTHGAASVAALLHRDGHVARAEKRLHGLVGELIEDAAAAGHVRRDVTSDELAAYCLHAVAAAATLRSKVAVRRLVDVTMAGLRPVSE